LPLKCVEVSSSYPKLATRVKSGRNDPLPKTQFSGKKKEKWNVTSRGNKFDVFREATNIWVEICKL
jgi:hypothetical protein